MLTCSTEPQWKKNHTTVNQKKCMEEKKLRMQENDCLGSWLMLPNTSHHCGVGSHGVWLRFLYFFATSWTVPMNRFSSHYFTSKSSLRNLRVLPNQINLFVFRASPEHGVQYAKTLEVTITLPTQFSWCFHNGTKKRSENTVNICTSSVCEGHVFEA